VMNNTTIVQDIEALETKIKALPNGINRNKMTSHLSDAKAHAQALELYDLRSGNPNFKGVSSEEAAAGLNKLGTAIRKGHTMACTCPGDGVVSNLCPVHGDVPAY
jgi:hypothetical protein